MKKLVLYASMALMAAGAFAFDSDPLDLQGNVESYTKTEYSVASKFGDYFRTVSAKYVHTYEDGLRKEIASYTSKDELVDKTAFAYNPGPTLATMTCFDSER